MIENKHKLTKLIIIGITVLSLVFCLHIPAIISAVTDDNYITFEPANNETNVTFTFSGDEDRIEYSTDKVLWHAIKAGGSVTSEKVYFRSKDYDTTEKLKFIFDSVYNISLDTDAKVSGNILSLINHSDITNITMDDGCFISAFFYMEHLIDASELVLPSTLSVSCFESMFANDTNLKNIPELPATELKDNCYEGMFSGCASITEPVALQATTLAKACYKDMFNGCESLETAPLLPATHGYEDCYTNMFAGCTSLDIVYEADATHNSPWYIPDGYYVSPANSFWCDCMFESCEHVEESLVNNGPTIGHVYYQKKTVGYNNQVLPEEKKSTPQQDNTNQSTNPTEEENIDKNSPYYGKG